MVVDSGGMPWLIEGLLQQCTSGGLGATAGGVPPLTAAALGADIAVPERAAAREL
jgi:hypothetical protein